ncbi:MAG: ABC transporter ATP-binding protein [Oscillospiraceae bacterium]|nr:ABC transporter ATP-binding protein [Oscillospiraceae bacterium]
MNTNKKIIIDNISKIYNMYNSPTDRLKEAFSLRSSCYHTEFYALKNISFDVGEGEIVGIMGRNGAGKSTLLKIITGVLQPTYGAVSVSGRISSLLELGAGFNPEYSGIENIYFYGTIMGLSHNEITERLQDILDFAEIGDYVYQPVKTYSSGMFARLAFSCAINVEPEILIVDEILSVGDIRFQAKCFKKFKEFKEKGVTILYVGHDISTMRTFCDRCIWLNQGEIVDMGDPTYISAKYVEFMYVDNLTEFTNYKTFKKDQDTAAEETTLEGPEETAPLSETLSTIEIPESSEENREERITLGRPLAHWGSCTGLIQDICITANGEDLQTCDPWDEITISFSMCYSDKVDYENLSAAFSIKNREGVDMIVKTTYDDGMKLTNPKEGPLHFEFKLKPLLTNGDYYLVLCLENRKEAVITYYEYIEGAKYFKVFESKQLFGRFLPDITTTVKGLN